MPAQLTRRDALRGASGGIMFGLAGCLDDTIQMWWYGCDKSSLYIFVLQPIEDIPSNADPIRYRNLSRNEQRLARKALDTGRYTVCGTSDELSANESDAWVSLGKTVASADDEAYLRYEDEWYRVGLARAGIIYGGSEILVETPEFTGTEPERAQ